MSFASQVKEELCRSEHGRCHAIPPRQIGGTGCQLAECLGVVLFCNTCSAAEMRIITENRQFARRLPELFRRCFNVSFDLLPESPDQPGKLTIALRNPDKLRTMYDAFGFDLGRAISLHVNRGLLEEDCCRSAFLRGAFLAGGSVTDPDKRYHLELVTSHRAVSREVYALLLDMGFSPKEAERSGSSVLYFKQSDAIEDFLTTMGAPVSAMHIMQAKVEKDLRNSVNRRVNCETANLTKVVDAAQEQVAAIERLMRSGQWDALPDKLRQTAYLRRDNPEATLQELAEMCQPPVSKSAVNHRLRKLLALAAET